MSQQFSVRISVQNTQLKTLKPPSKCRLFCFSIKHGGDGFSVHGRNVNINIHMKRHGLVFLISARKERLY